MSDRQRLLKTKAIYAAELRTIETNKQIEIKANVQLRRRLCYQRHHHHHRRRHRSGDKDPGGRRSIIRPKAPYLHSATSPFIFCLWEPNLFSQSL